MRFFDEKEGTMLRTTMDLDYQMHEISRQMQNIGRWKLWEQGSRDEKIEGLQMREEHAEITLQKHIDGQKQQLEEMRGALERTRRGR